MNMDECSLKFAELTANSTFIFQVITKKRVVHLARMPRLLTLKLLRYFVSAFLKDCCPITFYLLTILRDTSF